MVMKKMKKVLITGFEPFGKHKNNPSKIILESDYLPKINNIQIKKVVLSNDFETINIDFLNILNHFKPDIVISLGLDSKIFTLKLETIALNISFDHVNKGKHSKIDKEGRTTYINNLNIIDLVDYLVQNKIPAEISYHAGIYSCNYIYYLSQKWSEINNAKSIFIHLPYTHEMASDAMINQNIIKPSLSQKLMEKGIQEIISILIK